MATLIQNLKHAMLNSDRAFEAQELPRRLHVVTQKLDADTTIDNTLRGDLFDLLRNAVALAEAMVDKSYPLDLIVANVTVVTSISSALLAHAGQDRSAIQGYGIENQTDRSLLAMVFRSEPEAAKELDSLRTLGVTAPLRVVPVRVVSQMVVRRETEEGAKVSSSPAGGGPATPTPPPVPITQQPTTPQAPPSPPTVKPPEDPIHGTTQLSTNQLLNSKPLNNQADGAPQQKASAA